MCSRPLKKLFQNQEPYNASWLLPQRYLTKSQVNLMKRINTLWEQYDVWTRTAISCAAFDLPDADFVTKRLMENPMDFEQTLKTYYGDKTASKFIDLLKKHLIIGGEILKAGRAGDDKIADIEKEWYANVDEIAALFGSINPYWSQEDWILILHNHLALIKSEAVYMLTDDYKAGIAVYDEIRKLSIKITDMMAEGIVKQFPHKFTE